MNHVPIVKLETLAISISPALGELYICLLLRMQTYLLHLPSLGLLLPTGLSLKGTLVSFTHLLGHLLYSNKLLI